MNNLNFLNIYDNENQDEREDVLKGLNNKKQKKINSKYFYDDKGRLQNTGFLDYRMPVASDVPMIDAVLVEVPNPNHPYGVRGVGEPPIVPAPAAVANAVENAIGRKMSSLPLSPPKVLKAIQQVSIDS